MLQGICLKKQQPHLHFELEAGYPVILVAGTDEVGRGCIAGPVVAAACIAPSLIDWKQDDWLYEVRDSKLLTASSRERLASFLFKWSVSYAIGVCSIEEIDTLNILQASLLAMQRAIKSLKRRPEHVLVDGKYLPVLSIPATAIIKGDQQSLTIAAASIIAKFWRDEKMKELDKDFPQYRFAQHKGYPTKSHLKAMEVHGICEHHRRSFAPVKKWISRGVSHPFLAEHLASRHERNGSSLSHSK